MLVFFHVPKAAGTTFEKILRHHYPGRGFEKGANAFSRFELAGPSLEADAAREGRRAISGEITVGLADRHLPGDAQYLTILREPVARTLSHYYYLLAGRGRGLVPPSLPPPPADLSIEQSLEEGGYILDNLQTRTFCGIVSPFDPLPADALEQAKRNLRERFAFVGTTERLDEFVAVLNLGLGWPTMPYGRTRVNQRNLKQRNPSPVALKLVAERNALDAELYVFAGELLDGAIGRAGPDFEAELGVLREAIRRATPSSLQSVRALPVEARIELALKEGELAAAMEREAKNARRLKAEGKRGGR